MKREYKMVCGLFVAIVGAWVVAISIYGAAAYVVVHFIHKYW